MDQDTSLRRCRRILSVASVPVFAALAAGCGTQASLHTLSGVTTTPTTVTTAPKKKPKPKPPTPVKTVAEVVTQPVTRTVVATPTKTTSAPKVQARTPSYCLQASGLVDVRLGTEKGVTIGNAPHTSTKDVNEMVFVDGPYKTRLDAYNSAQTLLGTEYAAAGGHYVASATLVGKLSASVASVAACLNGAPVKKYYTF